MELRKTILRLLLGSLALAAAAGVLAVLLPIEEVMLRVTLTGVVTAVAAGLLMGLTLLLDRPRLRPAGLFGCSLVVVEFIVALVLIWLGFALTGRTEERLGVSMGVLALAGVPVLAFLLLVRTNEGRLASVAGTATSTLMFAVFMVATWLPGSVWGREEWWATGWVLGSYGLLAALSLVDAGTPPRRWWRRVGVFAAVVAGGLALVAIWDRLAHDEQILVAATGLACVAAFANVLLRVSLPRGQGWVAVATVVAAAGTSAALDLALVLDGGLLERFFWRLASAGGIVTGCGTLAVVVLIALNRRTPPPTGARPDTQMIIVCPLCGKRQRVPVGSSSCVSCRLRIDIRIAEPQCATCGYQLTGITSDVCPECGTPVGG